MKSVALGLLMLIMLVLAQPSYVGAADRTLDAFNAYDQSIDYGRGMSATTYFSDLYWSEQMFLEGYMDMYNVTGNREWLDKVIDHTDRMLGNAWDSNNDGYTGWPSFGFSHNQLNNPLFDVEGSSNPERLVNGSFESGYLTPDHWTQQGDANGSYRSTQSTESMDGTAAAVIESDGIHENRLVQEISYTPGKTYYVEAFVNPDNWKTQARVEIYNATTDQVIKSILIRDVGYERYIMNFTAPSSGNVQIRLGLQNYEKAGYKAMFDAISVKEVAEPSAPIVQSEAAGWNRIDTPLMNANRTNDPSARGSYAWALELTQDGASIPTVSQTVYNYAPNRKYALSLQGKISNGATGVVRVTDATYGTTLGSYTFTNMPTFGTRWFYFDMPDAGHEIRVELRMPSGASGTKFDIYNIQCLIVSELQMDEPIVATSILQFVNAVYENADLHAKYLAKADEYRDFIADNMVHKWDPYWRQITGTDGDNNGTGAYIIPADLDTKNLPGRSQPYNLFLNYASMLYRLYDATEGAAAYANDRSLYLSRANDMHRTFLANVYPHPLNATLNTDAYLWHYWDSLGEWDDGNYYSTSSEDLTHSGFTMLAVLEAYHHGQVYTLSDMLKFTRTLTDVMWNQSLTDPRISENNASTPAPDSTQYNIAWWANFAEFDHRILELSNAICDTFSCHPTFSSKIPKFYRNKTINPGFEWIDIVDPTLPMYWSRYQSTNQTAFLDNSAYLGIRAVKVSSNNSGDQGIEQKLETYEPNSPYSVKLQGKSPNGVPVTADVYDYTSSIQLGMTQFTNTDWGESAFSFRTPQATDHDIRVRLYTTDVAFFDEVRALPELTDSLITNNSFEVADRVDDTLPRFWQRGSATVKENVQLDLTDKATGLKSMKLSTAAGGAVQEISNSWRGYVPNGTYELTFRGKTNGSAAGGLVRVVDTTTNQVLSQLTFTSTDWSDYKATFTAPSVYNHPIKVIVTHRYPGIMNGTIWVDDVSVQKAGVDVPILSVAGDSIVAGDPVLATSSLDGTIYLVPDLTEAHQSALQAAAAVRGSSAAAMSGISTLVNTMGVESGKYKAYAVSSTGNVSLGSQVITIVTPGEQLIDEANSLVSYTGQWDSFENVNDLGGSHKVGRNIGDTAEIPFYGTRAKIISIKGANLGQAKVYVDGVYQTTIDCYGPTQYQFELFDTGTLAPGLHAVRIEVANTKNSSSSNYYIALDGIKVPSLYDVTPGPVKSGDPVNAKSIIGGTLYLVPYSTAATKEAIQDAVATSNGTSKAAAAGVSEELNTTGFAAGKYNVYLIDSLNRIHAAEGTIALVTTASQTIDDTSPLVSYAGQWDSFENVNDLGGSHKVGRNIGDNAEIPFYGTRAKLIGLKTTSLGKANIYVDGFYQTTIDCYGPTQYQVALFDTGTIVQGIHTIKIEVGDSKNSSSSNYYIVLDGLLATN